MGPKFKNKSTSTKALLLMSFIFYGLFTFTCICSINNVRFEAMLPLYQSWTPRMLPTDPCLLSSAYLWLDSTNFSSSARNYPVTAGLNLALLNFPGLLATH